MTARPGSGVCAVRFPSEALRKILWEFLSKSGRSVPGYIGGVSNPLADGREDGFLQCPGHRSIDQACERPGQFQSRQHWDLRRWNHADWQDVWAEQPDRICFGAVTAIAVLFPCRL